MRPHRWQPTRLPHPWDSPGKNTGVGCHFLLQYMKVKSESEVAQSCPTLTHPMTAYQARLPVRFSRKEYWSGVPLPSLKNVQTTTQLHSSHASKVTLKILQIFNSVWTVNFHVFKLVLEKVEEPEIKLPTSVGSSKKQESFRKTSISALLTMPKPLTVWTTINSRKFLKKWEYQTTWPASWEICMQVRKQQLELDMEQQTGSK